MQARNRSIGFLHQEIHIGEPIPAGKRRLFPVTRVVRVDFPGRSGGLIWNRPIGVLIREPGQTEDRWEPIVDYTRRAQVAIWGSVLLAVLIALIVSRRRSR